MPPTCTLWLNGSRFADGQPGEPDDAPVALTGLVVTWGRASTIDQPSAATCAFSVLDAPGGQRFNDAGLQIGARIMVRADATIYPDPTRSIVVDPSFESAATGSVPSVLSTNVAAGRPVVSTTRAHTGTKSARIDPADASRSVRVILPPAPLSAAHDASAWDAVPKTTAGQSWSVGLSVWLGAWLGFVPTATVRPAYFDRPWGPARAVSGPSVAKGAPDANGWTVFAGTVTPPADVWIGVCLDLYPTGPRWDDVAPAVSWDSLAASPVWDSLAVVYVDDVTVLAPATGAARAGCVFNGRLTDLQARYDTDAGATIVDAIAQDDTAELANRYTGSLPAWPAESLATRMGRIVAGSGQSIGYTIDPSAQAYQVSYRANTESAPALSLARDLAASVAGALWCATSLSTGPYLYLEDMNSRPAMLVLVKQGSVIVIAPPTVAPRGAVTVDACSVLLDPVQWEQTTADIATRTVVSYQDQTDPVNPKAMTVSSVDAVAEQTYGRLRLQLDTELTAKTDAQYISDALLARVTASSMTLWRVAGLTWRAELDEPLTPAQLSAVMQILDGATRLGLPILLTNLPSWSPVPAKTTVAPLYLEGGRMSNTDGRWQLELVTSNAAAMGAGAVKWDQLDASWQWDQFDPSVTWNELNGVGI